MQYTLPVLLSLFTHRSIRQPYTLSLHDALPISIRVFAELLRLGRVPSLEKVREYGEYIEAEGRRLTRLIDNILDFARIEEDRKSTRLNSSHITNSYAVFCLKKKHVQTDDLTNPA